MAYEKTNWVTGDIVTAQKLNKIEDRLASFDRYGENRIVPVTVTDLITLYATMLNNVGSGATVKKADSDGVFDFTGIEQNYTTYICNEPVKKLQFESTSETSANVVFFVVDYDFDGIYVDGIKQEEVFDAVNGSVSDTMPILDFIKTDGYSLYNMTSPSPNAPIGIERKTPIL